MSKRFGAVTALHDASLTLHRGEIVALMGANGAGKSTFVKILTGALSPDGGQVRIKGTASNITTPAAARRAGLVPVYQEPSLIPDLDVADNLRLGDTPPDQFRHWVAELGIPDLRLRCHDPRPAAGHPAHPRPRPRPCRRTRRAAAG